MGGASGGWFLTETTAMRGGRRVVMCMAMVFFAPEYEAKTWEGW